MFRAHYANGAGRKSDFKSAIRKTESKRNVRSFHAKHRTAKNKEETQNRTYAAFMFCRRRDQSAA